MWSVFGDGAQRLPLVPVSPGVAGVAWSPGREVAVVIIANVISRPALGVGQGCSTSLHITVTLRWQAGRINSPRASPPPASGAAADLSLVLAELTW